MAWTASAPHFQVGLWKKPVIARATNIVCADNNWARLSTQIATCCLRTLLCQRASAPKTITSTEGRDARPRGREIKSVNGVAAADRLPHSCLFLSCHGRACAYTAP